MAPIPLDSPGSWLPVSHLKVGDVIACPLCGRRVGLTEPPMAETPDPWEGSTAARVQVHWTEWKPPAE